MQLSGLDVLHPVNHRFITGVHPGPHDLLSSRSASGSRRKLPPPERTRRRLLTKETIVCEAFPPYWGWCLLDGGLHLYTTTFLPPKAAIRKQIQVYHRLLLKSPHLSISPVFVVFLAQLSQFPACMFAISSSHYNCSVTVYSLSLVSRHSPTAADGKCYIYLLGNEFLKLSFLAAFFAGLGMKPYCSSGRCHSS